jgi:PAS domain S-box-containing protein
MSALAYAEIVSVLVFIHLGVYALAKSPRSSTNRFFAAFCFCLGLWSLADIFTHSPSVPLHLVQRVAEVTAIAWCSFASLFVCFIVLFTRNGKLLESKPFVGCLVALPLLCFWANWSGFLKTYGVRQTWGWPYLWAGSYWRYVFYAYYLSFVAAGVYLTVDFAGKAQGAKERKQARIISLASVATLIVGSTTDAVLPELHVVTVPRIGSVTVLILAFAIVYAMTRYSFLTITPATAAENIVSTMSDSLILLDPEANVVTANRATLDLLGYQQEELEGRPIELFIAEQGFKDDLLASASGGEALSDLTPFLKAKNGQTIPVSFSTSVLKGESGDCVGIVCIARDITERRRAEEALQKAHEELGTRVEERAVELSVAIEELTRVSRLKDEFLASMSHELRTPLNAILGLSESLQEEVYGSLNQKQRESLETIERSGRHLLELISDILDLAKIGAGELGLEIGPVSVESICQAAFELVSQAAQKKRIEVSLTFDKRVTMILADQRRLKQILVNLLSNAVKFTSEGGEVGLDVRCDVGRQRVGFTIWDRGIGISPEAMEHLFEPFVQLDSKLSRQHTGTGLGLALVRRLAELQGGKVLVESQVGKGSRFTVWLPWKAPTPGTDDPDCG